MDINAMTVDMLASVKMYSGKHIGKTAAEIVEEDPKYCDWCSARSHMIAWEFNALVRYRDLMSAQQRVCPCLERGCVFCQKSIPAPAPASPACSQNAAVETKDPSPEPVPSPNPVTMGEINEFMNAVRGPQPVTIAELTESINAVRLENQAYGNRVAYLEDMVRRLVSQLGQHGILSPEEMHAVVKEEGSHGNSGGSSASETPMVVGGLVKDEQA